MDALEKLAKQLELLTKQAENQLIDAEKEIDAISNEETRNFLKDSLAKARKGKLSTKKFTEQVKKIKSWE